MSKAPCSDPAPTEAGRLIVVEGMPGAGKTTACTTLDRLGHQVIGEYTTPTGDTLPVTDNPSAGDDAAHQQNWLTKHRQASVARRRGDVFCDRDWLTSLAYASSLDDHTLMARRCRWAKTHLARGQLAVADIYVVVHVDPATSMQRRNDRLAPGHPWATLPPLQRLHRFYQDPPAAVGGPLGQALGRARWHHLDAPTPKALVMHLLGLAGDR